MKGQPRRFSKAAIRKALTECRSINTAALELDTSPTMLRGYVEESVDEELKRLYAECRDRGYAFSGGNKPKWP